MGKKAKKSPRKTKADLEREIKELKRARKEQFACVGEYKGKWLEEVRRGTRLFNTLGQIQAYIAMRELGLKKMADKELLDVNQTLGKITAHVEIETLITKAMSEFYDHKKPKPLVASNEPHGVEVPSWCGYTKCHASEFPTSCPLIDGTKNAVPEDFLVCGRCGGCDVERWKARK